MNASSVSVIIPTKHRPSDLLTTFRSLLRQNVLPAQIAIVDQSSDNAALGSLRSELSGIEGVRLDYVYDPSLSGAAAARNRAMDLATGDIWLFLDDDVDLELDFIQRLLEAYERLPHAAGLSGIITNYTAPSALPRLWTIIFARGPFHDERQPIYWACERLRNSDPIEVQNFTSALMSFRRNVIGDVRFDPNYPGALAEDVDFCRQLPVGTRMFIVPQARLAHNRSPVNRVNSHWLRSQAESSHYLYERHLKRAFRSRVCFAWLKVGYAIAAVATCVRRRSLEGRRALLAGRTAGKAYAHPETRFKAHLDMPIK
jgi:GT2 family glycosyltransferase